MTRVVIDLALIDRTAGGARVIDLVKRAAFDTFQRLNASSSSHALLYPSPAP